jgi:hypothetical protein
MPATKAQALVKELLIHHADPAADAEARGRPCWPRRIRFVDLFGRPARAASPHQALRRPSCAGADRSVGHVGRQSETTLDITRIHYEVRSFAGAASDQLE